ncbi:hypothetical protein [Streptomyces sp. SPB4]|uniref:hypothetical protein n=1 Tax=Streptomyces sp. SPB4 TaxID=2940553 RepID=UPI0024740E4D|nr:hypothetical protein [Streptomyces sp. SPB4]MDH6537940.1 hypothetical protein [Streptomyces sp. SPB4]
MGADIQIILGRVNTRSIPYPDQPASYGALRRHQTDEHRWAFRSLLEGLRTAELAQARSLSGPGQSGSDQEASIRHQINSSPYGARAGAEIITCRASEDFSFALDAKGRWISIAAPEKIHARDAANEVQTFLRSHARRLDQSRILLEVDLLCDVREFRKQIAKLGSIVSLSVTCKAPNTECPFPDSERRITELGAYLEDKRWEAFSGRALNSKKVDEAAGTAAGGDVTVTAENGTGSVSDSRDFPRRFIPGFKIVGKLLGYALILAVISIWEDQDKGDA